MASVAALSLAERLAQLEPARRQAALDGLTPDQLARLRWNWRFWARPAQLAPASDWSIWLILAGRGFGKTRAGAEWLRSVAEAAPNLRLALVGASLAEVRAVMVEGESGLLSLAPPWARPRFEPSLRRLVWPNGSQAQLYSAEDADSLRGPEHHAAWCDELAKWPQPQRVWDMLALGLRLGQRPRVCVTTTPRPLALLKGWLDDPGVVTTRGRTLDNKAHLPPAFLHAVLDAYGGTRLARQELEGELIEDWPGTLWTRAMLDAARAPDWPVLEAVVVAVDPPLGVGPGADTCGIIAAGRATDGALHVLADASVQGVRPEAWARAVVDCARRVGAQRIVTEVNAGGALVASVLRAVGADQPLKAVHARASKVRRAEPVAALYEQGRVRHQPGLELLEAEMLAFTPDGGGRANGHSPDRVDALVWAIADLALIDRPEPRIRVI